MGGMKRPRILSEHAVKSLTRLGELPPLVRAPARVRLRQWLIDHDVTINAFSMMVCMNRRVIDEILRGVWRPKGGYIQLHQAFAIEWATKGYVPAYLWLDDAYLSARIRNSHRSNLKEFEDKALRHVLKWGSLKTEDGMLREKARVLSRLFNVQWGEVKRRAWVDAERRAAPLRADISYLLEPEQPPTTEDGILFNGEDTNEQAQKTDEEWFAAITTR